MYLPLASANGQFFTCSAQRCMHHEGCCMMWLHTAVLISHHHRPSAIITHPLLEPTEKYLSGQAVGSRSECIQSDSTVSSERGVYDMQARQSLVGSPDDRGWWLMESGWWMMESGWWMMNSASYQYVPLQGRSNLQQPLSNRYHLHGISHSIECIMSPRTCGE